MTAPWSESVVAIPIEGDTLWGVLAEPADAGTGADTAVVIVVGGPQYRAGSHRQFVQLARGLAGGGVAALRFDVRGMGDSPGERRSFEDLTPDIGAAIDALLQARPALRRVVLWGLCDGASASLVYLHDRRDDRVAAVCAVNPWVRSTQTLARTHVRHYYRDRLRQREFWVKLLSGRVAWTAVRTLLENLATARRGAPAGAAGSFQDRMAAGVAGTSAPVLIVLSEHDYTAREFETYAQSSPAWQAALRRPGVETRHVPGADHTFSERASREFMESITLQWVSRR